MRMMMRIGIRFIALLVHRFFGVKYFLGNLGMGFPPTVSIMFVQFILLFFGLSLPHHGIPHLSLLLNHSSPLHILLLLCSTIFSLLLLSSPRPDSSNIHLILQRFGSFYVSSTRSINRNSICFCSMNLLIIVLSSEIVFVIGKVTQKRIFDRTI